MCIRDRVLAFRVGKTTVSEIMLETYTAIWKELKDEFMPQPKTEHLQNVIDQYYRR